jgi:flagellar hook-basal body complex protein FliE
MTVFRPELVSGDKVPMVVTNPKHMIPLTGKYTVQGDALEASGKIQTVDGGYYPAARISSGRVVSELEGKIGAEAVLRAGSFDDVMLKALDKVSGAQQTAADLVQMAITEPGSMDPHDITIAQAEASMSLNITRTILNRIVQGWRDLINTR